MELGSAIAISSGILGTVAVIFKIFPKNGTAVCMEHRRIDTTQVSVCTRLEMIESGICDLKEGQKTIHKRLDDLLLSKE